MGGLSTLTMSDGYPAEADDVRLVRAARTEPEAFGELYDRYVARVYRFLRTRTESDEDAADLTQQVFTHALDGLGKYRGEVPFAAWLFRIARNAATDAHRRRRGSMSWDSVPEALRPLATEDPEATAIRRESLMRLRALLAELSPEKRELIDLRFVAELGIREIAEVVKKNPAAVHKQIGRTLRYLEVQYHER